MQWTRDQKWIINGITNIILLLISLYINTPLIVGHISQKRVRNTIAFLCWLVCLPYTSVVFNVSKVGLQIESFSYNIAKE